jgi:hypothetical protein
MIITNLLKDNPVLFDILKEIDVDVVKIQLYNHTIPTNFYLNLYTIFSNGFIWSQTDEGYEYWSIKDSQFGRIIRMRGIL